MKTFRLISIITLFAIVGCSANRQVAKDDIYYSPYGTMDTRVATSNGAYVNPSISSNTEYDYQRYYSDSKNYTSDVDPVYQTTETVTDTNGVVYTTTETYYDADFATRIKRFGTQASSSRDYYDDYYTGGDTYYIYTNSYDPYYWNYYPSFYVGWGYRPYWRSYYWGWDTYWGYPYYAYWGWDPYWSYGWGYHSYWHHHHHHHHGHGLHHD